MGVSRPLPKAVLKRMFLKVLNEHKRPGGAYKGHGWSYKGIVRPKICHHFEIPPLTDDEYAEGLRGVYELERDGYIMQDPSQSSEEFKVLTAKGKSAVEQSLEEMKLPSIDIDQLVSRDDLREKIHDEYLRGDYETAIFKAFRLLEESVRSKAGQSAELIGAKLMSAAFRPNGGVLKHPDAKTAAEREGLHLLMRGAIMWFKNPSSHRTVAYADDVRVAHVLGLVNLLLDIVEEC